MIFISLFVGIFLTSLTGTVIFGFWRAAGFALERRGEIGLISFLLRVVLFFYLVPVVFACLLFWTGAFADGEAGSFLTATPLLIQVARFLAVVWLVGFLVELVRYMLQQKVRRVEKNISMPAGAYWREAVGRVRERLQVTEEIPVYELPGCKCPFISGFIKCCIFIPKNVEDEEEMEIILEHELYHYVKKDLHLKKFCAWIVRVQWFNPLERRLVRQVDVWGDSRCDYYMCYESGAHWDMKDYFDVVLRHAERKKSRFRFYDSMHMARNRREIQRRIERMRKVKMGKGMRRASAFVLGACFIMASAVTSLAAGGGLERLYQEIHAASMEISYEAEQAAEEAEDVEEYARDRADYAEIVRGDDEVDLDSRSLNSYTWDIRAGVVYETGLFWATKGDKISVTANPSPASSKIGTGLDCPDGVLRGISGTGPLSGTFTVRQTGFHRVFVENMESTGISVVVAVSR